MLARTKGAQDPDTGPSQYTADPGHAALAQPDAARVLRQYIILWHARYECYLIRHSLSHSHPLRSFIFQN